MTIFVVFRHIYYDHISWYNIFVLYKIYHCIYTIDLEIVILHHVSNKNLAFAECF